MQHPYYNLYSTFFQYLLCKEYGRYRWFFFEFIALPPMCFTFSFYCSLKKKRTSQKGNMPGIDAFKVFDSTKSFIKRAWLFLLPTRGKSEQSYRAIALHMLHWEPLSLSIPLRAPSAKTKWQPAKKHLKTLCIHPTKI